MDAKELERQLPYFTGTEKWTRISARMPWLLLTDGALFLAENAGAFWFFELIGSHQNKKLKDEFQVWKLKRDGKGCLITCEDGNLNELARQQVDYTDFPLDDFECFANWDDPEHFLYA